MKTVSSEWAVFLCDAPVSTFGPCHASKRQKKMDRVRRRLWVRDLQRVELEGTSVAQVLRRRRMRSACSLCIVLAAMNLRSFT
jgi:hypothetical protein